MKLWTTEIHKQSKSNKNHQHSEQLYSRIAADLTLMKKTRKVAISPENIILSKKLKHRNSKFTAQKQKI